MFYPTYYIKALNYNLFYSNSNAGRRQNDKNNVRIRHIQKLSKYK